jgi:hypothetical protein
VTNATMGRKSTVPDAMGEAAEPAAVPEPTPMSKTAEPASVSAPTPEAASVSASTPKPASMPAPTAPTAPTAPMTAASDCRDVRDNAKRANSNARRQNTYRSLLHGALSPIEVVAALQGSRADSLKCNCRFRREFPRYRGQSSVFNFR